MFLVEATLLKPFLGSVYDGGGDDDCMFIFVGAKSTSSSCIFLGRHWIGRSGELEHSSEEAFVCRFDQPVEPFSLLRVHNCLTLIRTTTRVFVGLLALHLFVLRHNVLQLSLT